MDPKKQKETAIFEAACAVIRDKGFHQARIMDIAARAGISYGLVYHYFRSKSRLFDAIFHEWWNGLAPLMESSENDPGPVDEKLRGLVDYFLDLYEDRPNLVHVFITEISRSTANLSPEHLGYFKAFFARLEKIIANGQAEGTLRKDVKARYLTYIFVGALEGFLSAMVLENQQLMGRSQKQRISHGLLSVFFNGAGALSARPASEFSATR
jgi:AcrR family transcriptional regulator